MYPSWSVATSRLTGSEATYTHGDAQIQGSGVSDLPFYARPQVCPLSCECSVYLTRSKESSGCAVTATRHGRTTPATRNDRRSERRNSSWPRGRPAGAVQVKRQFWCHRFMVTEQALAGHPGLPRSSCMYISSVLVEPCLGALVLAKVIGWVLECGFCKELVPSSGSYGTQMF